MSDYGIKISLPGKDISSTDPNDFVLNSKYSAVKIVQQPDTYETVVVNAGSNVTVTIAHNLGFTPLVMVYWEPTINSGHWYMGVSKPAPDESTTHQVSLEAEYETKTYVDDTNLYIYFKNTKGTNETVKYFYFIFGDNG